LQTKEATAARHSASEAQSAAKALDAAIETRDAARALDKTVQRAVTSLADVSESVASISGNMKHLRSGMEDLRSYMEDLRRYLAPACVYHKGKRGGPNYSKPLQLLDDLQEMMSSLQPPGAH
jgi:predicted  nucleic acid-binding Zn-ribbon protein